MKSNKKTALKIVSRYKIFKRHAYDVGRTAKRVFLSKRITHLFSLSLGGCMFQTIRK